MMSLKWPLPLDSRRILWLALAAFLGPFLVYLLTLAPTFTAGDSGELIPAAYYLGVPHPPGYPLYCLAGKLFITLIPFGNIGWRMNVMSAFFASLAGLIMFFSLRKLLDDDAVSLAGALFLCFALNIWGEATEAEVYTMILFFSTLLIWLALKWEETRDIKFLYGFSLTAGLGVVAHQTVLMILPVFFVWVFGIGCRQITFSQAVKSVWLLILGLAFYLYLPIRSLAQPMIDWGFPQNLYLFLSHIMRIQYYGVNPSQRTWDIYLKQVSKYFYIVSDQWPLVFFAVVGLGLVYQFQKSGWRKSLVFLTSFLMSSLVLIFFTNYDVSVPLQVETQRVFYFISFIFLAIWLAYGFKFIMDKMRELFAVRRGLLVLLIFMVVLALISYNFSNNNEHQNYIAYDYARNLLKSCEKDAILWVTGDVQVFSVTYARMIDDLRPDISLYDSKRLIFGDQFGRYLWPMITLLHPDTEVSLRTEKATYNLGRPVYYGWLKDPKEMPGYYLAPAGLANQLMPHGRPYRPPYHYLDMYETRGVWEKDVPKSHLTREIVNQYENTLVEYLMVRLGQNYLDKNDLPRAGRAFAEAIKLAPDLVAAYEGLAEVTRKAGDMVQSRKFLERAETIRKKYGYR